MRLGEVLTAVQMFDVSLNCFSFAILNCILIRSVFQNKDLIRENYEFLRLMNVFSDDSFLSRLSREDDVKCA